MAIRKIVLIDEEKCNGCGVCVPACAEGAIQIIEGKARPVSEIYCDGLGACLGECPQGAITIEEREAADFDEAAVHAHLETIGRAVATGVGAHGGHGGPMGHDHRGGGCPGSRMMAFKKSHGPARDAFSQEVSAPPIGPIASELEQWPVQLTLVPVEAPYFKGADLVVAADCVPFAYANFHRRFLRGHALAIGCPKLDDPEYYLEKLTQIFARNDLRSVTVVHMEVPCCFGLLRIVREAAARSGKNIPIVAVNISVQGEIIDEQRIRASV